MTSAGRLRTLRRNIAQVATGSRSNVGMLSASTRRRLRRDRSQREHNRAGHFARILRQLAGRDRVDQLAPFPSPAEPAPAKTEPPKPLFSRVKNAVKVRLRRAFRAFRGSSERGI